MTDATPASDPIDTSLESITPPLDADQLEQVRAVIRAEIERREADGAGIHKVQPQVDKPLADYRGGEAVYIFQVASGDWVPATVAVVEKKLGLVYVNGPRGPITIASTNSIRPRQP